MSGYSSEREKKVNYEHKKLLKQGANPDAARIVAREIVKSDAGRDQRRASRKKQGTKTKLRMSFSKRNEDDTPIPKPIEDHRFY